jgi:hypothetical protein
VPPDLDLVPYFESDDTATLARIRAAMAPRRLSRVSNVRYQNEQSRGLLVNFNS